MLSHHAAKLFASKLWGYPLEYQRTNRIGAYYFSGFVIDSRCLSQEETDAFVSYAPDARVEATEYYDRVRNIRRFSSEVVPKRVLYHPLITDITKFHIWKFDDDLDWCIPVKFARILLVSGDKYDPEPTFQRRKTTKWKTSPS